MEFKLDEVSYSSKFRVLTNLLPGVDVILGKPWLKNAGPAINFETGCVYVDGKHALGPKTSPLNIPTPSSSSSAIASTSTKSEVSAPVIEESAATKIAINVIGAKAMHKLLKGSNEATSLLFISETPDQDAAVGSDSVP